MLKGGRFSVEGRERFSVEVKSYLKVIFCEDIATV